MTAVEALISKINTAAEVARRKASVDAAVLNNYYNDHVHKPILLELDPSVLILAAETQLHLPDLGNTTTIYELSQMPILERAH